MIEVHAAAKVNVAWQVGPLREDGFHHVRGVLQTVSLFDTLRLEPARGDGDVATEIGGIQVTLTVAGEEASPALATRQNSIFAAARLVAPLGSPEPAAIHLTKRIPVAAGLGGGSADAAAALVGLARLWGAPLGRDELFELAAIVGSDVPAILLGGLVHASGRGEVVRNIGCADGTELVLGVASGSLSTPAVYRRLDRLGRGAEPPALWRNDLEPAALALDPTLREALTAMRVAGAAHSFVSGSGPTVVGVPATSSDAQLVAMRARQYFRRVIVCHGVSWGVRVDRP